MDPAIRSPSQSTGLARGELVVCVRGEPTTELRARIPDRVPVIACGDAVALGEAIEAADPADVVVLDGGCEVGEGWLDPLMKIARSDPGIATVSPVVVPEPGDPPVPPDAAVPRLAAPDPGCAYIRRGALELLGMQRLTPGNDFAARCRQAGLWHVLAAGVVVTLPSATPRAGDDEPGTAAAGRRRAVARRRTRQLSVLVDARILSGPPDGTRVHVLELIGALARAAGVEVGALVAPDLPASTGALLATLPGLAVHVAQPGRPPAIRADVVHRPHQVSAPSDLSLLAAWGRRVLVTQQDLIGYHNPGYFADAAAWGFYRELTALALAVADHVLFPSAHARRDALSEELVTPGRSGVVAHGVDHAVAHRQAAVAPAGASAAAGEETLLCLGTDLVHKNRPFALRIAAALRAEHDWRGTLVLAGPRMEHGSSWEAERTLLTALPQLAGSVLDLPAVSDGERRWLLQQAALVLYPTLQEGFGFLPFEAAAAGRPCLWAPGTAMSDVLPDATAGIVPWDASLSARRAAQLLRDDAARAGWLDGVGAAAAPLTWDATAAVLCDVYAGVAARAPNPAGVRERLTGLMQGGVSEDAMRLVGPGGLLPADAERPLLALAARPRAAGVAWRALRAGYRLSRARN